MQIKITSLTLAAKIWVQVHGFGLRGLVQFEFDLYNFLLRFCIKLLKSGQVKLAYLMGRGSKFILCNLM